MFSSVTVLYCTSATVNPEMSEELAGWLDLVLRNTLRVMSTGHGILVEHFACINSLQQCAILYECEWLYSLSSISLIDFSVVYNNERLRYWVSFKRVNIILSNTVSLTLQVMGIDSNLNLDFNNRLPLPNTNWESVEIVATPTKPG